MLHHSKGCALETAMVILYEYCTLHPRMVDAKDSLHFFFFLSSHCYINVCDQEDFNSKEQINKEK
jgi:hypothetical protein